MRLFPRLNSIIGKSKVAFYRFGTITLDVQYFEAEAEAKAKDGKTEF